MFVMNIHFKLFGMKLRSLAFTAVTLSVLLVGSIGSASAMGINGLIGVIPGFPQIDGSSTAGQGANFIPIGGGEGLLTVTSTPNLYFPDAGSLVPILPDPVKGRLLELTAIIDSTGASSASVEISWGSAGGLPSPLLVAEILEYGLENTSANPGGTDRADFLLNPLGGSMLFDPNWITGSLVGMTLTLEGSTYNGNLDEAWHADRTKFVLGQVAVGLSEPTTLPMAVIGLAGLWLLRRRTVEIKR